MYAYLVIISICLTVFGIAYTFFSYRNKERLALIEAGLDLEYFKNKINRQHIFLLSIGLVFIGFSIGILTGFFFEKYLLSNYNPNNYSNYPQAYICSVSLFVGISLLLSFFISRKQKSGGH